MRRLGALLLGLGLAVLSAVPAAAQGPGRAGVPPRPEPPGRVGAPGVEFLLASTGALHLTDQQVTRLAAIARRAAARREAMRASADSLRLRLAPGARPDSALRRERAARVGTLVQAFRQTREQEHADLRDALGVLTPDQLADAWELIARRGMRAGPPIRATGAGALRMRNRLRGVVQPGRGMVPPPPPAPGNPQP